MRSLIIFALVLVAGCEKQITTEPREEKPLIVQSTYTAPSTYKTLDLVYDPIYGDWEWEQVEKQRPPEWSVTFSCQHGQFSIDGEKAKEIHERFAIGQEVYILYREVLTVKKENGVETTRHVSHDLIDVSDKPLTIEK